MQRFKSFLLEYLTANQREKYAEIKLSPKAKNATDPFFGESDMRREELQDYDHDKSEVHKRVEQHLQQEIPRESYAKGTVTDKYGREAKIGRLIKDEKLRNEFASDNTRAGAKSNASHYMTIVRGTEVAGQTNSAPDENHPKGHSWGEISCKNVDTGMNNRYLDKEIHHGTVVVRAHDHNNQEIYRATLHPHENDEGHVMYGVNSEYGVKHPSFQKHARDVATRLSGDHKGGSPIYDINPHVYNDTDKESVVHPGASEEDLSKLISSKNPNPNHIELALQHPKINTSHVAKAMESDDPTVRIDAASHPKADESIISAAMQDKSEFVRAAAAKNPNATDKHINKALKDEESLVVQYALKNPNINPKHIDAALKNPEASIRIAAVSNPKASHSHLQYALRDVSRKVREAAVSNPNVTSEQLMNVIKNDDENDVIHRAFIHPNITKEHLDVGMASDNPDIRYDIAKHPKATAKHIQQALNDTNYYVRAVALNSHHTTLEHVKAALNDPSDYVRFNARKAHKKLTGEYPD